MPKKKPANTNEVPGKTRVELRFDEDVYREVKNIADHAQISLNQLLHGLARWAVQNGHAGEPFRGDDTHLRTREQPGCVWFGHESEPPPDLEERMFLAQMNEDSPEDHNVWTTGKVYFTLDFTERRVIREDIDVESEIDSKTRKFK